jgi:hypothetical protein
MAMTHSTDICSLCGSTLVPGASIDDVRPATRTVCSNDGCPGKWSATEPGGEHGVRRSYDVPGLNGVTRA